MDDGGWLSFIVIFALILMDSYFSMSETVYASVSRIKIKTDMDRGDYRAKKAMYILDNFDKAVTTLLIGTNIVTGIAAAMVALLVVNKWGVSAVTLSTFILTIAIFFFGEMLPKSVGKKYSERLSLSLASSVYFLMKLLNPLAIFLTKLGGAASKFVKGDTEVSVTEDELYDIIESMKDEGDLGEEKGELIHSALTFAELSAESVATPRVDIAAIDINKPLSETLKLVKSSNHSRFPVYEGVIDNIVGVLQIRKFMKAYIREGNALKIGDVLDEVHFAHQSIKISELLSAMNRKRLNMAVITDNYGGTFGIVTIEDILEELVGDIWDEDDDVRESCVKLPDGGFDLDPELTVEEVFELIDYDDPDDFDFEHKLIGEWAFESFDDIPVKGDSFEYNGLVIKIAEMNNNRIIKLTAYILPDVQAEGGSKK